MPGVELEEYINIPMSKVLKLTEEEDLARQVAESVEATNLSACIWSNTGSKDIIEWDTNDEGENNDASNGEMSNKDDGIEELEPPPKQIPPIYDVDSSDDHNSR